MGCDIHLHIEVKLFGKWENYDNPSINRWYLLFEKMAGVRGDVAYAIAPPRGLPEDCNPVTMMEAKSWGSDGHSHSWLSKEEIVKQLIPWIEAQGARIWEVLERDYYFEDLVHNTDDVRFVFWFDN